MEDLPALGSFQIADKKRGTKTFPYITSVKKCYP